MKNQYKIIIAGFIGTAIAVYLIFLLMDAIVERKGERELAVANYIIEQTKPEIVIVKESPGFPVIVEGFTCYISGDEMTVNKAEYEVTVSVICSYNLLQSWFKAEGDGEQTGKETIEPNGPR